MKCNGGAPISLSKVRDALYLRPLILGLFASISDTQAAKCALPMDAPFALEPVSDELEGQKLPQVSLIEAISTGGSAIGRGSPSGSAASSVGMPPKGMPLGALSQPKSLRAAMASVPIREMARQRAVDLGAAGYLLEEDEAAAIHEIEAQLPENYR